MVDDTRLERLKGFGFSDYAGRAYLALLDLGVCEARDVSNRSKVPQAKIYNVLDDLHEKGLVLVLPEYPKKYVAVAFEEFIDRLREEHEVAATELQTERENLASLFARRQDAEANDRGFFTIVRGRRAATERLFDTITSSRTSLVVVLTEGLADAPGKLIESVAARRTDGVEVHILAPLTRQTLTSLADITGIAEVRDRDGDAASAGKNVAVIIADGARAFLIHRVPDDGDLVKGDDVGVYTDQEAMVAAIAALVAGQFGRAAAYDARHAELIEGRPRSFTRILTSSAEADTEIMRTLSQGVARYRSIVATPQAPSSATERHVAFVRAEGGTATLLLNLPDAGTIDAANDLIADDGAVSVRHHDARFIDRLVIVDEREAFISIIRRRDPDGAAAPDAIIHTNDATIVGSLHSSFESMWHRGLELPTRQNELRVFPDLKPGDVGLGRIFHRLADPVLVTDVSGTVLLWNPASTTMFDRTAPEMQGRPVFALLTPASATIWADAANRLLSQDAAVGEGASIETQVVVGGEPLDIEWRLSTIMREGGLTCLLAIGRDLTSRRRARQAELRAQADIVRTYERMSDAFFALDRDWKFTYRNPVTRSMQRMLTDEQIDGQDLWQIFPQLKDTKFFQEYHRAMREHVAVHFEEYFALMGRWFEVSAYPGDDGLSVFFRDITERKQRERSLSRLDIQLKALESGGSQGTFVLELPSREMFPSAGTCEIFGLDPGVAPQWAAFVNAVHVDDRSRLEAAVESGISGLSTTSPVEFRIMTKRGDVALAASFTRHQHSDGDRLAGKVWRIAH